MRELVVTQSEAERYQKSIPKFIRNVTHIKKRPTNGKIRTHIGSIRKLPTQEKRTDTYTDIRV